MNLLCGLLFGTEELIDAKLPFYYHSRSDQQDNFPECQVKQFSVYLHEASYFFN